MELTMDSPLAVRLAVKTTIGHLHGDQEVYDGFKRGRVRPKVRRIVQEHPVDADITLLDIL